MQKTDYYKIAFFALLAAVVAGGAVYFWMSSGNREESVDFAREDSLEGEGSSVSGERSDDGASNSIEPGDAEKYQGWELYKNEEHDFGFWYPPEEVEVIESKEENYVYCVYAQYGDIASVIFQPAANRYSDYGGACGRTGMAAYDKIADKTETVEIGGSDYLLEGVEAQFTKESLPRLANPDLNLLDNHTEFLTVDLPDGSRIKLSSAPSTDKSWQDYLKIRGELIKIIESYKDFNNLGEWEVYKNTKLGFKVSYPDEFVISSGVDEIKGELVPATPKSDKVYLTNNPDLFICCETTYISIEVLDEFVKTARFKDWIEEKKFIHSDNEYRLGGKRSISIDGREAYRLHSECGVDSPGNVVLVNNNNKTYFIKYHPQKCLPFSEQIISSFQFL